MATAEVLKLSPFGSGNSLRSYSASRPSSALRVVERELRRSATNSQYLWRILRRSALSEEIKALSKLATNWDSYGAMPPADSAIHAANEFLLFGSEIDLLPNRALASAEGGVALRFVSGSRRALIEFLNSGSVEVMLYDEIGTLAPELEEPSDVRLIAHAVHAHLTR